MVRGCKLLQANSRRRFGAGRHTLHLMLGWSVVAPRILPSSWAESRTRLAGYSDCASL